MLRQVKRAEALSFFKMSKLYKLNNNNKLAVAA